MRSSEATASPAMSSFLAVRVSTERSQHTCASASPRRPLAARSSTVTGITKRSTCPAPRAHRSLLPQAENVVCQERFLDISARAEQLAGGGESLGDFGDHSRRAENREFRAERREQVTAMTLPPMIGMDGDLVNEGPGRPFGADQDADRVGAREGDHAAAAPDLQVADRPLERGRRHLRLVRKVRTPAAIQRVDEKPDVVGATKTIRTHADLTAQSKLHRTARPLRLRALRRTRAR